MWGDNTSIDLVDTSVKLNNTSLFPLELTWHRTANIPTEWISLVCDAEYCKLETVNSAKYIQPSGKGQLIVHFGVNKTVGEGMVTLNVVDSASGENLIVTYFCKVPTVGVKEIEATTDVRIYPNPVGSQIFIANLQKVDVQTIEIYDLLGKKHLELTVKKGQLSYPVNQLRQGMYIARFLGSEKAPLLTRSFNKI